jgi:hypothetical protein
MAIGHVLSPKHGEKLSENFCMTFIVSASAINVMICLITVLIAGEEQNSGSYSLHNFFLVSCYFPPAQNILLSTLLRWAAICCSFCNVRYHVSRHSRCKFVVRLLHVYIFIFRWKRGIKIYVTVLSLWRKYAFSTLLTIPSSFSLLAVIDKVLHEN